MSQFTIFVSGGIIFTLLCLGLLGVSLHQNKFRLLNGALCNMALLVSGVTMIIVIETSNIKWLNSLLVWTLVIISIPLLLLYTLQGVPLLWNAFTVWRKESHTLGNMLTLGLGIMVIVVLPLMRAIDLFSKNSVTLYNAFVVPVIFYLVFSVYYVFFDHTSLSPSP